MADDDDSSSASDDAGDTQTYMAGEVRCVAGSEADASYVSALTDLSIREEGKSNGSSDVEHNDSENDDDDDEYYECCEEMPKSDGDKDHLKYTDGLDSDPMLRDHSFTKQTDIKEEYAEEMCNTIAGEEEAIEDEEEEKEEMEEKEESNMGKENEERQQEKIEISLTFPKAKSNGFSSKSPQVPVSPVSADKLPQIYLGQQAANYAKLYHLSKTTCQDIMREILRHKNPKGKENQHLQNILKKWEKTLTKKWKRNQIPFLSDNEKAELFCNTVTYDKLDMSLMYKIAKNLLQGEIMSLSGRNDRWEVDPPDYDVSLQACIEKLRKFRNQLSHSRCASLSDEATLNNFQYIRDVIVQIEKHINIDPQYSLQVDFIQNAQLSPDVAELQIKLEKLESERDALKDAAKNELEVRQNLKECLKKYCDELGMFNKNVNGQDAQTRKCIENHEGSDRFYVETKASKEAMDVLNSKHHVLITGNKGSGKSSLAYHLLYKLMPSGRCTVHVLDSLSDIRKQKINTDGFVIALIELNEIKEKQRADLNFIISELISPNTDLSLYIIMTTMSDNVDEIADLTTQVDLSNVKEFALDEQEKRSILEQQLKQEVKKTGVPLLHLPTQDELTGIVKEPSYPISFPLAASLFAKDEKYRRLGPTFFRSPVDYFLSEIESVCKAKPTFVLLLHLVFQDVTGIINSDDIRTWITELDVDHESTKKAGKRLNGHLTLSCRSHIGFQLRNQCVRKAFALYLAKKHLQRAMTCLDQEYIVDTSTLSCRAENTGRCVQLLSENNDKELLARRFFREILADKTTHLSKSDAWLDDTFVDLSIDVLVHHIRGTKEDDKVTVASSCIDKLYHWAVSHRCMLLCKRLRKHIDDTFVFGTLPNFTEQLMKRFMLVACKTTRDTLCIADKEITKIELLRFFVEQGSRCNFCTPMVECDDDEGLRYLLREGVLDPHPDWGFWNFLHTAASEGDTLLCNCNFVKLLSHRTEDIAISKENEGIAEFAQKVKSLKDDSDTSKRHFFFSCIETIGLNQSLMMAMKQHQFAILKYKNEKEYNGLHVAITSTLPDKRVRNTITVLALTELDLQQHVNKEGETPLMMAVQLPNCDIQRIAELLRQNADPNYASRDKYGHTALHLCIRSTLDDETVSNIVSTLTEHNADITKRDLSGETPISLAISKGKSRLKTLGSLVKGRDVHTHATQYMLHYCIQLDLADNDKEEVVKVLIREGVSVNQKNDKGLTPIMVAIQKTRDNADLVRQLLNENADVTITDNEGLSPLHHCCKAQHTSDVAVKIAQWLIQRDQSGIESPDKKRKTPLMYAIMNENHTTPKLVFDLIEKVTDVNAVDSGGNTVMHLSMASHFEDDIAEEIAERLMTKAADPFVLNNYSQSSPMCGLISPKVHLKSISRILEKTAGDSFRPCKDIRGRNLLHLCVDAADVSDEDASTICKQAIVCGESVHERTKKSKSALEMAVSSKSVRLQTICSMLCSSGLKLTCEIYDMLKKANKLSYEFLQLLLQHKIDLDEVCRESKVPYHDITDESQTEVDETIVLSLIRLGFDINKTNSRGDSAIMTACRFRCTDAILLALGGESDLTKLTNEKETYLHLLSKSNRSDLETRDAMKSLMTIAPVNVNHMSRKQRSALAESVIKQKKDTVQFLIQKGADHNQKDRAGKTPIHHCVEGDWFDDKACAMLDILIEGKTNVVDMLDNSSASALDLASSHESHSRLFTILRLLELGSDVETVDQSGKSPIQNCLTHLRGHRKSAVLERTCRLTMLRVYGVLPFSKDDDGNTAVYICDKPEWRNRLEREKRILLANMVHVPALFEEVVKSSFASLNDNDTFSHVEYPVKKLTPRVLELMKYSSKLLHREVFDVCEDDEDFDTLSDFLEIREFEAR